MRMVSLASRQADGLAASQELAGRAVEALRGPADLALLLLTRDHAASARAMAGRVCDLLETDRIVGGQVTGLIAGGHEHESGPALALVALRLPRAHVRSFHLDLADWRSGLSDEARLASSMGLSGDQRQALTLLLADPETTPTSPMLAALRAMRPDLPALGGLIGGDGTPGLLLRGRELLERGAVGLAIEADLELDFLVGQGCRPVGPPMRADATSRNLVMRLDGRSPLSRLQEVLAELGEAEREIAARGGLFIGRPRPEARPAGGARLGRGDFLVRRVIGFDEGSGVMAVADWLDSGEVLQFQLRDAATAAEDLDLLLATQAWRPPPAGLLLFAGEGRGQALYGRPDGDLAILRSRLGELPMGGCFCRGEIAPLEGHNLLHGQSLGMALLRPAAPAPS